MRKLLVILAVLVGLVVLLLIALFVAAVAALVFAGPALMNDLLKMLSSPSVDKLLQTLTQVRDLVQAGGGGEGG